VERTHTPVCSSVVLWAYDPVYASTRNSKEEE